MAIVEAVKGYDWVVKSPNYTIVCRQVAFVAPRGATASKKRFFTWITNKPHGCSFFRPVVLKLVGTPHAMLVERFQIMWPDGGGPDLQVRRDWRSVATRWHPFMPRQTKPYAWNEWYSVDGGKWYNALLIDNIKNIRSTTDERNRYVCEHQQPTTVQRCGN